MKHPFAELIDLQIDEQRADHSTLGLLIDPKHLNPHGVVHGAVVCALADTGMGAALYPGLAPGLLCATIDISINYFKPITAGRLVCRTEVVNRGKSVAHLRSEVFVGEQRVAAATGNYAIFAPRDKAAKPTP